MLRVGPTSILRSFVKSIRLSPPRPTVEISTASTLITHDELPFGHVLVTTELGEMLKGLVG